MGIFSKVVWVFCVIVFTVSWAWAQSTWTLIDWMYENGLTIYQTPEEFKLNQYVTRGEVAKFLNQYATTLELEKTVPLSQCQFSDIETYDITLIPHIIQACEYGLIKWFEWQYFPEKLITQAEALTIVIRSILGIQDETWDPRRTITHQKAENLWVIEPLKVEALDVSAKRWMIWFWLYTVANSYVPTAEGKDSSDIYSSSLVSWDTSDWWVYVTFFDGTIKKVAEPIITSRPSDDVNRVTYSKIHVSPDSKRIAIDTQGYEESYVQFYDTISDTVYGKVWWLFERRNENSIAYINTCYRWTDTCQTRRSINNKTPWIFPEVRAQWWKIWFVCEYNTNTLVEDLLVTVDWMLHTIQEWIRCSWIQPDAYSMYAIPEDSLVWAMTTLAWKENYFYVLQSWDEYQVYSSTLTNETDNTYWLIKTFSIQ